MVFFYQNCSDLLWEKIVLDSDQENLRSLEQFFQAVKGQKLVPGSNKSES